MRRRDEKKKEKEEALRKQAEHLLSAPTGHSVVNSLTRPGQLAEYRRNGLVILTSLAKQKRAAEKHRIVLRNNITGACRLTTSESISAVVNIPDHATINPQLAADPAVGVHCRSQIIVISE